MNPWIWRLIILGAAICFVPLIVSGTASLVVKAIHGTGASIHSLLRPLSMPGDARLEGLIRLCLYLISITLLLSFLFGKGGKK